MSFIHNIKNSFGSYFLKQEAKRLYRKKMFVNMQEVITIGIVFDATDQEDFNLVKKYITYLREMKKKVKAIGFFNQKEIPPMTYSKLEYDFFSAKELNWHNFPTSIYVKNFLEDEFDVLLDLNIYNHLPLKYISTLSKAKFKVGKKSDENNSTFDLMIEIDETKSLKYFLRNIDTYLFMINAKSEKLTFEG